jgi:2-dehydro-3-deoxyphosphogluconate aldolase/(4S)-4-hydroxy-2-oxoglutarate aldolase
MSRAARASIDAARSDAFFEERFADQCLMAVLRGMAPAETVELCRHAWKAGVELVEVTLQSEDALPSLEAALAAAAGEGRLVGAGTVTSAELAERAAEAGATFTVAPGLDPEVAAASLEVGLPHLPGVATPSEIQSARKLGFSWMKAFPAAQLTPGWFKAMLGPFPGARFVATGGVEAANAQAFLGAGARAVGVGSALADPTQVELLGGLRRSRP